MITEFETKGGDATQVIEVATSQLTEHSKQAEFSPKLPKKEWRRFLAEIATNGITRPIHVTKGFRVICNEYHFRAAKELGIESVRVIIEDIPEDDIPTYIINKKLDVAELSRNQIAALVVMLHYEEERIESEKRMRAGKTLTSVDGEVKTGGTAQVLADKSGIGKPQMERLLAVYKRKNDLFKQVLSAEITIRGAYAKMKAEEEPKERLQENPIVAERKKIEELSAKESSLPQMDESQPSHELNNRLVQMRKKALSLTVEVLDESEKMNDAKPEVRESARSQLLTLTRSCVLALGQTAESDDDAEVLAVINELLNRLSGGN